MIVYVFIAILYMEIMEGYLVWDEKGKDGYIMNFSNQKVKVFLKNANDHKEYNSVTEFLNKDIL